jgi:hypothetical protein
MCSAPGLSTGSDSGAGTGLGTRTAYLSCTGLCEASALCLELQWPDKAGRTAVSAAADAPTSAALGRPEVLAGSWLLVKAASATATTTAGSGQTIRGTRRMPGKLLGSTARAKRLPRDAVSFWHGQRNSTMSGQATQASSAPANYAS